MAVVVVAVETMKVQAPITWLFALTAITIRLVHSTLYLDNKRKENCQERVHGPAQRVLLTIQQPWRAQGRNKVPRLGLGLLHLDYNRGAPADHWSLASCCTPRRSKTKEFVYAYPITPSRTFGVNVIVAKKTEYLTTRFLGLHEAKLTDGWMLSQR